jgi:ferredoxin, 2Fe-2S
MIKVTYVAHDGTAQVVEGHEDATVMATAITNGVSGIDGQCGGSLSCASCHVYVDREWAGKVGPAEDPEEQEMLESAAAEVRPTSRLSCQIVLSEELDGLRVEMPESQW